MSNLLKRTGTGIICIVLIITSILVDQHLFAFLFLIVTVLSLWEFYSLVELDNITPNKYAGIIAGSFVFTANALISLQAASLKLLYFSILTVFVIFLLELYRKRPKPFTNIAYNFLGIIYIAFPLSLLNYFPNLGYNGEVYNNHLLLGFFYLVWVNETGAYVFGRSFGKKKLFESVSPKKSWEGFAGGGLFVFIAAWIISIHYTGIGLIHWLVIALIIVVFGTYGDLFESMFKRSVKAKDSGSLLPGHGGILDRFDGVLIAVPFVFAYLLLIL